MVHDRALLITSWFQIPAAIKVKFNSADLARDRIKTQPRSQRKHAPGPGCQLHTPGGARKAPSGHPRPGAPTSGLWPSARHPPPSRAFSSAAWHGWDGEMPSRQKVVPEESPFEASEGLRSHIDSHWPFEASEELRGHVASQWLSAASGDGSQWLSPKQENFNSKTRRSYHPSPTSYGSVLRSFDKQARRTNRKTV